MKHIPAILFLALLLASCGPAQETAMQMANTVKDDVYETSAKVKDWATTPPSKGAPQAIAASYCYHTYQDILCYRQPMPGWEFRLAGYQPLDAAPPLPAIMLPLPVHAVDASKLPVNRVAGSKPVFSELPAQATEAEKPADETATPAAAAAASDATHEQLPDPALAPQL